MQYKLLRKLLIIIWLLVCMPLLPKLFEMSSILIDDYEVTTGKIIQIKKYLDLNPGYNSQSGFNENVLEIVYVYSDDGLLKKGNNISFSCSRCSLLYLEKTLSIKITNYYNEYDVVVYKSKTHKNRVFLVLPNLLELMKQAAFTLLFLVIAPFFLNYFLKSLLPIQRENYE